MKQFKSNASYWIEVWASLDLGVLNFAISSELGIMPENLQNNTRLLIPALVPVSE